MKKKMMNNDATVETISKYANGAKEFVLTTFKNGKVILDKFDIFGRLINRLVREGESLIADLSYTYKRVYEYIYECHIYGITDNKYISCYRGYDMNKLELV